MIEGQLIASRFGERAKYRAQPSARIFVDADRPRAGMRSLQGAFEQRLHVAAHDGEWNHAEI